MASQYKSIQGIKYERDLLEAAELATARGRSMTKADAANLWEKAMDGNKVTPTEARTLEYILSNFKVQEAGKLHLRALLDGKSGTQARLARKGSSYYKTMNGVSYDRALLDEGASLAAKNGGVLSFKHALHLWGKANDGAGVTECEKRTLQYISQQHRLEIEAKEFFEKSLDLSIGSNRLALKDSATGLLKSLWHRVTGRASDRPPLAELPAPPLTEREPAPDAKRRRVDAPSSSEMTAMGALSDAPAVNSIGAQQNAPIPSSTDRSLRVSPAGSATQTEKSQKRKFPEVTSPIHISHEQNLQPELQRLLSEIMGGSQGQMLQLECPAAACSPEEAELAAQRAKAAAEVARILEARTAQEVLGGGSKEEQHREFRRIALLLHPDKGFVDHDNQRANLAMRLAVAAHNRSRRLA